MTLQDQNENTMASNKTDEKAAASGQEEEVECRKPSSLQEKNADGSGAAAAVATAAAVTTTTTTTASSSAAASSSNSNNNKRGRTEMEQQQLEGPLDLAQTFSLRPGDRIEVQWQIFNDDNSDGENISSGENNNNGEENKAAAPVESRWWGATLLEHDGRTEDSVAIRTLDYDPYEEGGFPERSLEDVIFIGPETLISYKPQSSEATNNDDEEEIEELTFRIVRDQNDNSSVSINRDESNVMKVIDAALMGAMNKQAGGWTNLSAAQQADIAFKIKTKKQKLVDLIMNHDKAVVTPNDMQDILAKTME